ncbi:PH domain-containing protein [Nocardioides sp. zg-DK7169]|uniref:PH domain-containing protein n=1 Tax=Nocardioides sp. zg-DK7169 TaxID=2736600 RepID=UPI0015573836|nr:PH domain-containing protein [Nocardioides sp. zg-DK7169]NPC95694.1 PH domain-containing protein [Nocardioides sp. zg-DK7169]
MGTATSDLREPHERVCPRARLMWWCTHAIGATVLLAVLVVGVVLTDTLRWWLVPPVAVVLAAYAVAVPQWRYLVHRWEVTATAVYTQTGWWARERRIAPISRVQTVDLEQGAAARVFGLATVTVTTASAAGPLAIPGLDLDVARALVDELTLRADATGPAPGPAPRAAGDDAT